MGLLNRSKKKTEEKEVATKVSVASDTTTANEATEKKAAKKKIHAGVSTSVIVRPVVTEKTTVLASTGVYVFEVERKATKVQVSQAIKALYNVIPTSVNTQVVRGKVVRFGRREGKRRTWKKAMVTLPKGTTIDVYQGV